LGAVHLRDEGSTNGTFLNGHQVTPDRPVQLAEGDRVQLGSNVVLKLVRLDPTDERFQREMFERTVRDTLTGLYNRSYFLNRLGSLQSQNAGQGLGLAILMLDVDHFKRVNDRYGHAAGDLVLRQVSCVLRESTRGEDLVARYGGEEFIIALPVSALNIATGRAERIRSSLASRRIALEAVEIQVTVSIGLAFGSVERAGDEVELIVAADQALYQAKAEGRNRVVYGPNLRRSSFQETQSDIFISDFSQPPKSPGDAASDSQKDGSVLDVGELDPLAMPLPDHQTEVKTAHR
jgi:diguanylate cyclase (GGDEF)-like protein